MTQWLGGSLALPNCKQIQDLKPDDLQKEGDLGQADR